MRHSKARLLGIVLILVFAGLIYDNWNDLASEGRYSLKLAAFGPVGVVGGLFVLLFPSKSGRPETTDAGRSVLRVVGERRAAGALKEAR